jgi:ADP-ribosylglycohydrolase
MLYDSIKIVDESVGLMRYNYETREPFDKSEYKKIPKFERYQGKATYEGIKKFMAPGSFSKDSDVKTYHNLVYNSEAGGNGSAMRTLCIGMCYFGENNRESLIDLSLDASVITHYNAYGYLAGLNASLFVAFALEGIPIKKWPYLLLEYLKSSNAKKYLTLDDSDHIYDYSMYIRYWTRYIETKFDKNGNPLKLKSNKNPMHRIRYFYDNFHKDSNEQQIGASGFLCMIMAYDALLDCDGKWEKLVVYAILHNGDSDTIGAVAGGLYGAVYGFGDVPQSMLKHLEKKDELIKVAKGLYDKYAKTKKK